MDSASPVLLLVNIAGSVALLLWGVHMMQTGVQRAFGPRLRTFLAAALRNRLRAFAAGLGVTAALQSSTATGLMVAGFAAGGTVALVPALAVMLGANVGTTLIVQVLSFNVAALSPLLVLVGYLLFRRSSVTAAHDLGRVFIGLGLMLMALRLLIEVTQPLEQSRALVVVFQTLGNAPLVYVAGAALITWAAHSSVAIILFVMSLASRGAVPMDAAFALVLGANLGTAVNPILEGSSGEDPASRRLPLGNLINRCIGVAAALAVLPLVSPFLATLEADRGRVVADFHLIFNLVVAAISLPLLSPYAALLERWLPARTKTDDPARPVYLDEAARAVPALALGSAARESLRLADVLEAMLQGARDGLAGDRKRIDEAKRLDDVLDRLNAAIKSYLTSLEAARLGAADGRRLDEILTFTTNMEHAGDTVDRSLLPLAAKRLRRGLAFSREGQEELDGMMQRLLANVRMAASLFTHDDPRAARMLAAEKEAFRDLETAATRAHFERLREGRIDTAETSALHLDVIRDLKRINSHLVAGAAYPVLEREGELLPTRIASAAE
jgi:phosphate:Na+ symporter